MERMPCPSCGSDQTQQQNDGIYVGPTRLKAALGLGTAQKWRDKGLQSNMTEVTSARDLVDSLMDAGNKLLVVDFFSPGCGACRALHPKICQLAEMNTRCAVSSSELQGA